MRTGLLGLAALTLAGGCIVPAEYAGFGGFGGVILLPNGSVSLPREDSLMACADAVRAGAANSNPESLGAFQSLLPGAGRKPDGVVGVCTGPDGLMSLVTATEIRPGARVVIAE
jgi:hypothetical protein